MNLCEISEKKTLHSLRSLREKSALYSTKFDKHRKKFSRRERKERREPEALFLKAIFDSHYLDFLKITISFEVAPRESAIFLPSGARAKSKILPDVKCVICTGF
jgi:hypothetical protein